MDNHHLKDNQANSDGSDRSGGPAEQDDSGLESPDVRIIRKGGRKEVLAIDELELPLDAQGCVDITNYADLAIPVDFIPDGLTFEFCGDGADIILFSSIEEEGNAAFWISYEEREDDSPISTRTISQLISMSVRALSAGGKPLHEGYADESEAYFSADAAGSTLAEVLTSARQLLAEVLVPVRKAENMISKQIQELANEISSDNDKGESDEIAEVVGSET